MELVLLGLVALAAAVLTFFTGFGLGTILLPALALFMGPAQAVALTAVVHGLSNLLKFLTVKEHLDFRALMLFGVPAMVATMPGAILLILLEENPSELSYALFGQVFTPTLIEVVLGVLIVIFSVLEIVLKLPGERTEVMILSGVASGFFGGLSGHQGALRSAVLIRLGLSKEGFIATGALLAFLVDLVRVSLYAMALRYGFLGEAWAPASIAVAFALAGTILGRYLLPKVKIGAVRLVIMVLLAATGVAMILGVL